MQATGQRDTDIEMTIRRSLHARGHRYRVDHSPVSSVRSRPDIVFTGKKLAIYIDGCFWHGCPEHATWPKKNSEFWREKIERNRQRDRRAAAELRAAGWEVMRIWEHVPVEVAVERIERALALLGNEK